MDTDVIAVRSLLPLRCYNMTMGQESGDVMCNNFLMAAPNSKFLQHFIAQYYIDYPGNYWGYNVLTAMKMARKHHELIHVEKKFINHPNWHDNEIKMIFDEKHKFDWRKNFVVHLWNRVSHVKTNPEELKSLNSSFGELARMVYYQLNKEQSPFLLSSSA